MGNFFDILGHVTYSKKPYSKLDEEERKNINVFMLNKYLSMNDDYIEFINYTQFVPYDKAESYYKIYSSILPKRKIWNKYIKGKKEKTNQEVISLLSQYYKCSDRESFDYLNILSKDDLKQIFKELALDDKEIKKLLK